MKPNELPQKGEELFEKLLTTSTLSPIFARASLLRTLERVGLTPAQLTPAELGRALPEIKKTLQLFLPESKVEEAMKRISQLVR